MNPGKVLVFLKKSKGNSYYPVYEDFGILPINQYSVQWGMNQNWTEVKKMQLKEVIEDIKKAQNNKEVNATS